MQGVLVSLREGKLCALDLGLEGGQALCSPADRRRLGGQCVGVSYEIGSLGFGPSQADCFFNFKSFNKIDD